MPRLTSPTRPRAHAASDAFPLSDDDRAYLARVESLIHTLTGHIATYANQYDPLKRPPHPSYSPGYNYFPYPREFAHCVRTLRHLQELWHSIKLLLYRGASQSPLPADTLPSLQADLSTLAQTLAARNAASLAAMRQPPRPAPPA